MCRKLRHQLREGEAGILGAAVIYEVACPSRFEPDACIVPFFPGELRWLGGRPRFQSVVKIVI